MLPFLFGSLSKWLTGKPSSREIRRREAKQKGYDRKSIRKNIKLSCETLENRITPTVKLFNTSNTLVGTFTGSSSIQDAVNAAAAGYRLDVNNDETYGDFAVSSGYTGLVIRRDPAASGAPVVDGNSGGITVYSNTNITADINSNITLSGLRFTNSSFFNTDAILLRSGAAGSIITLNRVEGYSDPNGSGLRILAGVANVTMTQNTFDSNNIGVFFVTGSGADNSQLLNNFFTNNTSDGVRIQSGFSGTGTTLHNNQFSGNGNYNLNNDSSATIDASSNWWNGTNAATIAGKINGVSNVDFSPFLNSGDYDLGTAGFQPDLSYLHVTTLGVQVGTSGRIQEAVNDLQDGSLTGGSRIINVLAGTYADNVQVNKSVSILGPNASINPNTGSRVAEAIVVPAVVETSLQSSTSGTIFRVGSGSGHIDVTIKGLTIDGHNASLSGGRTLNGVEIDTGAGIVNSIGSFDSNPGGYDAKMIIQNNIIKNLERYGVLADGVVGGTPLGGTDVSFNKIDNLPSGNNFGGGRGRAAAFEENHYGTFSFNVVTRANVGWQDDNYYLPAPGGIGTLVTGNTISSYHRGIFHNLQYQNATNATITNNTLNTETSGDFPASSTNFGLELASIQSGVGATVTNNSASGHVYGILIWNVPTTATITVSGGTLTNNQYGVYVTNYDPQFGDGSASSVILSGLTINNSSAPGNTGIFVNDDAASTHGAMTATITGSTTITNGTTGLLVSGANARLSGNSLNNTVFTGQSGQYVTLANGAYGSPFGYIDGTGASYGGVLGSAATLAQGFAIENKITHGTDTAGLGYVRIRPNLVYVTQNSGSIQRGVNVASSGDTLYATAGTFAENVTVNKSLTLRGANAGIAGNSVRGLETTITTPTSDPSIAGGNDLVRVTASSVTIDGFQLDGNNPLLPAGSPTVNGVTIHARYGVTNLPSSSGPLAGAGSFANNLTLTNTIEQNLIGGVVMDGPYATPQRGTVTNNLIRWLSGVGSDNGIGVGSFFNYYLDTTSNVLDLTGATGNTVFGIWAQNNSNPIAGGSLLLNSNQFTLGQNTTGFFINNNFGNSLAMQIANNTINAATGVVPDGSERPKGIRVWSSQGTSAVSISNNNIGNTGGQLSVGISLWNNPSNSVSISGGSIDRVNHGISIDSSSAFGAAQASSYSISSLTINATFTGIRHRSNGVSSGDQTVSLTNVGITTAAGGTGISVTDTVADGASTLLQLNAGVTIAGGATGLLLNGTDAKLLGSTLNNLVLTGQTIDYVTLSNGAYGSPFGYIDGTGATYGGVLGSGATLAQGFVIEDKITHGTDAAGLGYVRITPNLVYVTQNSGSVQRGVNVAAANDTLYITAGTFAENVSVDKTLTIRGAQYGVNANTRFAAFTGGPSNPKANPAVETILTASYNDPTNGNPGANDLLRTIANNITVDGLVIDGNNAAIAGASTVQFGGVDIDARRGITTVDALGNYVVSSGLKIQNNIIQNVSERGVNLDNDGTAPAVKHLVTGNVIRSFGDTGVILFWNAYTDVTNNTIDARDSSIALSSQNFFAGGLAMTWSGNTITVGQNAIGVHVNLFYDNGAALTISGNTINAATGVTSGTGLTSADDLTWGINLWSFDNTVTVNVSNNTIGSSGGQLARGINLWNITAPAAVTVSGGTIGNSRVGINMDATDPYYAGGDGIASVSNVAITGGDVGIQVRSRQLPYAPLGGGSDVNPAGNVRLNISGGSITGATTGILVEDSFADAYTASVQFLGGTTISGATTGLRVDGAQTSLVGNTLANTTFTGITGNYVTLANSAFGSPFTYIDGTAASYNGVVGNAATVAQGFAIEDKFYHGTDASGLGYVRITPNIVYVTQFSNSIQRGVDAATAGDTVYIQSGTYTENVTVNKTLMLNSVTNATVNPASGNAFTITSGTTTVQGNFTTGARPTEVQTGTTLQGTGTITGPVTVNSGGFIAPGTSPGILNTGNYNQAGTYVAEINGVANPVAGTNYDQINVTGTVTLSGTLQLNITNGAAVNVYNTITLINNDSNDAVSGSFSNYANGQTFTMGGATWVIFYNGGDGNDVTLTKVAALVPSVTYASSTAWLALTNGTFILDADFTTPGNQSAVKGYDAFNTIQSAINAVASSGTTIANPDTYKENLTINKSVSLQGPNSLVAGNGVRGAEAIIMTNGNQNAVVTVTANNVSIKGFLVTGDDTALVGQPVYSGADANALFGITNGNHLVGTPINNLTVQNNIVQRVAIGFLGNSLTGGPTTISTGNTIDSNLFQDIGVYDFGYAVSLRNDFNANVTNNVMKRVYTGIHVNNNSLAAPGFRNVTGNTIQSYANGLWDNQAYSLATPLNVANNNFTEETQDYLLNPLAAVANNIGILVTGGPGFVGTTFTNNTITDHDYGLIVWGTDPGITFGAGNSINNAQVGVYVTNNVGFNPIGSTALNLVGTNTSVNLTGLAINNVSGKGIWVRGDSGGGTATATLSGTTISSASTTAIGINLDGTNALLAGATLGSTQFTGLTNANNRFVTLTNSAYNGPVEIDGTSATYNGVVGGNTLSLANAFSIEDKINDYLDINNAGSGSVGFVRLRAGYVYVTQLGNSIQRAINAAVAGDIVSVQAGTYNEDLTVPKSLTLQGPNAGINPNTGSRVAEAIIHPATQNADFNSPTTVPNIYITTSGVTIDGLTIDGNNTSLTSGFLVGGVDVDSYEAIASYEGVSNINIQNNVVANQTYAGLDFYNFTNGGAATGDNYLRFNKIDNIGYVPGGFGIGVLVYNNFYAAVDSNVMTNVRLGVQTGNFSNANPGAVAPSISNNQITATRLGIFHNLQYNNASLFTISGNTITAATEAGGVNWWGIGITSIQIAVGATISNNTINATAATVQTKSGYVAWNNPTSNTITISGGSVTGADYGIQAANYLTPSFQNADPSSLIVSGVTITNSAIAGIWSNDSPSNTNNSTVAVTVTGNTTITGSPKGILVSGSDASANIYNNLSSIHGNLIGIDVNAGSAVITSNTIYDNGTGIRFTAGGTGSVSSNNFLGPVTNFLANNTDLRLDSTAGAVTVGSNNLFGGGSSNVGQFANPIGYYIDNRSNQSFNLVGSGSTFNRSNGTAWTALSTGVLADNYRIEDRLYHALDNATSGLIRVVANTLYITTPGSGASNETIQRGVNAAAIGDTIRVEAGTYAENVIVSQEVTIWGAGQGSTIVVPSFIGANTGGGSLGLGVSSIFLVRSNNVTIRNLTADGDNPLLPSGIVVNGADIDARNGIITDHQNVATVLNLNVHDVTVKNIYLRGIYASTGGGTFTFNNNIVQNVAADPASIGIFNFGGSGTISNNQVSLTNDGISANHSKGTNFIGNSVSTSSSGIHTDNAGDSGGVPDLIQGNTVQNGTANSYGIFVFVPYNNVQISTNIINNVDVGLAAFAGAGGSSTFTNNQVDTASRPGSYGAVVSTTALGFGSGSVYSTFTGNTIKNGSTLLYIEQENATDGFSMMMGLSANITEPTSGGNDKTSEASLDSSLVGGIDGVTVSDVLSDGEVASSVPSESDTLPGSLNLSLFAMAPVTATVVLNGNSFDNSATSLLNTIGIDVNGGTVTMNAGNQIIAVETGLRMDAGTTAVALTSNTLSNLAFTGVTGNYITLKNGALDNQEINGTAVSYNGVTGSGVSPTQGFAIEDKIQHAVDAVTLGFIRVRSGQVFVTPNSFAPTEGTTTPLIQRGIIAATTGNTVYVQSGTYNEDVDMTVTPNITLQGEGAATTTIVGQLGGSNNTVSINSNETIDGFTITRVLGGGENGVGLSENSGSTGVVVRNNIFTGNRTAIYVNGSGDQLTITRNLITNNRTGIAFFDTNHGATQITENNIINNKTFGILFFSTITSISPNLLITNNNISGNWASQLENDSSAAVNASGNWWGTNTPTFFVGSVNALLALDPMTWSYPGPVSPPGSPFPYYISGTGANLIDFTPYLNSGTDIAPGTNGFQGDFSNLWVTPQGAQFGAPAYSRIQEGYDLLPLGGGTIHVLGGSYTGNVISGAKPTIIDIGAPATTAQITINGSLTLTPAVTINFNLSGPNVSSPVGGTDYDQIVTTGSTDIGGATFNITKNLGYFPNVGANFALIRSTPLKTGSFNYGGLVAENAVIAVGGLNFKVNYNLGSGPYDLNLGVVIPNNIVYVWNGWSGQSLGDFYQFSPPSSTLAAPPGGYATFTGNPVTYGYNAFSTIQSAINAVSSGATIRIYIGTYSEDITVSSGKNNLQLVAFGALGTRTINGVAGGSSATVTLQGSGTIFSGNSATDNFVVNQTAADNLAGIRTATGSLGSTVSYVNVSGTNNATNFTGVDVGAGTWLTYSNGAISYYRTGIKVNSNAGTVTNPVDIQASTINGAGWASLTIAPVGVDVGLNGFARLTNSNVISGNRWGVRVLGGTAMLQGNNLSGNNHMGASAAGLFIANGGVVDAGQVIDGTEVNYTGLGISLGNNLFTSGYAMGSAQAIVNLNANFGGPPSGTGNLTDGTNVSARNNNFGTSIYGNVERIVNHAIDNNFQGYVDYRNAVGALAPQQEGVTNYYAVAPGEDLTNQRSLIRGMQFVIDSPVVIQTGAFTLTRRADQNPNDYLYFYTSTLPQNASVPVVVTASTNGTTGRTTVNVTFSSPNNSSWTAGQLTEYGSLVDGNYRKALNGSLVNLLFSGSGVNLANGAVVNEDFHRFYGDLNGDTFTDAQEIGAAFEAVSYNNSPYNKYFALTGGSAFNDPTVIDDAFARFLQGQLPAPL